MSIHITHPPQVHKIFPSSICQHFMTWQRGPWQYYTHGYDWCPLSSTNKIKHTTTRDNFCSKNCRKRPAQYTGLGEKIADRSMTRKILRMGFSRYILGYQCTVQQCTSLYIYKLCIMSSGGGGSSKLSFAPLNWFGLNCLMLDMKKWFSTNISWTLIIYIN